MTTSPPLPPTVILVYPSPCSLIPHLSIPAPIPLFLSRSLFSCSLADLPRHGWRVHALQRLQCGDCMSCGSHSSLACRLHRQLLLQLILNQLALSSPTFQRAQTAATSDSRAARLMIGPRRTRNGRYPSGPKQQQKHLARAGANPRRVNLHHL